MHIDFHKDRKEYEIRNTYTSLTSFKASISSTFFDSSLGIIFDLCLSETSLSCN